MKEITLFNRYSLWAFAILLVLPFIYKITPVLFSSYFDAFDKVSIPLWAALYSLFWIIFNQKMKQLDRKICLANDRVNSLNKKASKENLGMLRKEEESLSQLTYDHADAKIHLEFINVALRATVIVAALVKIISLFFLKS